MAGNAFITFFDKAEGESTVKGREGRWIEVLDWSWDIEADTSWTAGGGASVGKPRPGQMSWSHRFDIASPVLMGFVCSGRSFPKMELQMTRASDGATWFSMVLEGVFVTKVSNSGTEEGTVAQLIEMVFKNVRIDYRRQDPSGALATTPRTFTWDIPTGTASPSS